MAEEQEKALVATRAVAELPGSSPDNRNHTTEFDIRQTDLPRVRCWQFDSDRVETEPCPGCGARHIHGIPVPGREDRGAHCGVYPKPEAVRNGYFLVLMPGRPPATVRG